MLQSGIWNIRQKQYSAFVCQFWVKLFYLLISIKDAFNLENLFPQTMNELVEKMMNEPYGDDANKLFK